jgi:predicted MFS family arabinose efflux permease/8-oxo-dGTP pyrophosphatase MutT (NUDIX family)
MQTNTVKPGGQTAASRLMWFFAFAYVAEGLAQVSGILRQPLNHYLLDGLSLSTASITYFMWLLSTPWMVKPLYGLVSDCVPLFGYRRKSYLIVLNLAATAALLVLTSLTSPAAILAALMVVVTAMAASSALYGGLLVEHGKASGLASKFCSQQTLWVNIANIAAALAGGWLCSSFAPAGALHWAALIALFAPLLVVLSTCSLVQEEKTKANWAQLKLGMASIWQTIKTRSTWGIAGFLMLWAFDPGFGNVLYTHMKQHLHFSDGFIGSLSVCFAAGAALGGLVYMKVLAPRYSIKKLAGALIVGGACVQALFVFMDSPGIAVALNIVFGFTTAMALLNAHVIATNRCPDHAEGFMYGILLSAANVSFSTSQAVGGKLYDGLFHQSIEPLILVSAAITLSCIFLLPFFNFERKSLTAKADGDRELSLTATGKDKTMNQASINAIAVTAEAGIDIALVTATKQYQDWLASMDGSKYVVKSVHIQSVDMFGKTKVGFIKFKAEVTDTNGKPVAGIVFMRGGAVGMLVVLNKKYAVLTVQPRVPTGAFDFVELPAGMLDGSGNFAGVAAKEIEEELHIKIPAEALKSLDEVAGFSKGFYVSPGGSDETIRLFYHEAEVTDAELADINGRCTGLIEENEQICLKIVPLEDLWKIPDGKTIVAYTLYQKVLAQRAQA